MKKSVPAERAQASRPAAPVLTPSRGFGPEFTAPSVPIQAKTGAAPRHDFAAVRVHPPSTEGTAGSTGPIQRMFNGEESKEDQPEAQAPRPGAFSHLPFEMGMHIMSFLPKQDIASLAATSRQTNGDVESAVGLSREIRMQERGGHRRKNIVKQRTAARVGWGLASFAHHRHFTEQRAQRGRPRLFSQF